MNRTKNMISEAFTQLLEEKPISKITVKDIADRCEINRNTFYYHFRDIPDLCEYICKQKINELIQNHCQPGSPQEAVSVAAEFFSKHSSSLLHVYQSLPRDVFLRYLNQLVRYLVQEYLDTACKAYPLPEKRRELLVRYYKCVLVGIFLDWLDDGMRYDLSELAALICDLRSESGKKHLEKLSQLT